MIDKQEIEEEASKRFPCELNTWNLEYCKNSSCSNCSDKTKFITGAEFAAEICNFRFNLMEDNFFKTDLPLKQLIPIWQKENKRPRTSPDNTEFKKWIVKKFLEKNGINRDSE